jgi:hypothetical protein
MSSRIQNYSLITLNDRIVPGFAGILRESVRAKESLSDRELKVVVASLSHVSEGKAIKFAKKVTKHIRIGRGWSFVSASIQSMEMSELPPLGAPQQTDRSLTAWIVEQRKRLSRH